MMVVGIEEEGRTANYLLLLSPALLHLLSLSNLRRLRQLGNRLIRKKKILWRACKKTKADG
jgi:hypothetical protein